MSGASQSPRRATQALTLGLALCAAAGGVAPAFSQERHPRTDPGDRRHGVETGAEPGPGGGPVVVVSLAYRNALETLATGSPSDAAAKVLAFETEITDDDPTELRGAAERGELAVLEELARSEPAALLPALVLHLDLYRLHRDRQHHVPAAHHATVVEHAAALYAVRDGTPDARAAAAEALAALGAGLSLGGFRQDAQRVLADALKLDPDSRSALLGLAILLERDGDYGDAVRHLERLVAVAPAFGEARLRWAINLRRTGRDRAAEERLGELVAATDLEPDSEWAVTVAYAELARMRLSADDPHGAERWLTRGLARFPDSERLHLARAYAVDRAGRPAEARTQIEALSQRPSDDDGETPRRRYNHGLDPATALAALAALQERASEHRASLASALAESAPPEGSL